MGEQPLPKHGACNLGSINLSEFVENPFKDNCYFNFDDFRYAVHVAIEALDTIVDENLNNHALPKQKEMAYNYRNIGLGIMGMHDMLIKMGIKYGSKESFIFMDEVMKTMFREAVFKSNELAKEKGAFPKYKKELFDSKIIHYHFTKDEIKKLKKDGLRNCSLLSIAPTGTLGTMLNISTGGEPLFATYYNRKTESLNNGSETYYKVYPKVVEEYIKTHSDFLPPYINCAKDINWKERISMQQVLQKHVDTAISSTVNLPNDISIEEVEQLYLYAWEKGLKGVTIYREGCMREGILTTSNNDSENLKLKENKKYEMENIVQLHRGYILDVSEDLIGYKRKIISGCGGFHLETYFDEFNYEPFETFINIGSSGTCERMAQGISRLISLALRGGIPIETIADQLISVRPCNAYTRRTREKGDTSKGTSCPSAIGFALMDLYFKIQDRYFSNVDEMSDFVEEEFPVILEEKYANIKCNECKQNNVPNNTIVCPECGSKLQSEGGCIICKGDETHAGCGWSKCD